MNKFTKPKVVDSGFVKPFDELVMYLLFHKIQCFLSEPSIVIFGRKPTELSSAIELSFIHSIFCFWGFGHFW